MPRAKPAPKDGLTKFQRYRRTQADKGMKLLRVWVPDPTRPEFAKEAARPAGGSGSSGLHRSGFLLG